MVRHHQRPGGKRHELPRQQKGEGVIGQHDERHGGKERRIKRQHAPGRGFVLPIADRKQARAYRAEIDHDQKESRERIQSEMRTEPGNAERQRDGFSGSRREKVREGSNQRSCRGGQQLAP